MTAIRTISRALFFVALGVICLGWPFVVAALINAARW